MTHELPSLTLLPPRSSAKPFRVREQLSYPRSRSGSPQFEVQQKGRQWLAPQGMLPPVCGGGEGSWGPPSPTDPAWNLLNLAVKLSRLPDQPAHHLIYNLGSNKADMGGTKYLPTIWHFAANSQEKEFQMDDISQLERTQTEPSSATEAPAPIRWRDLNKAKMSRCGTLKCLHPSLSWKAACGTMQRAFLLSPNCGDHPEKQCFAAPLLG